MAAALLAPDKASEDAFVYAIAERILGFAERLASLR
jgi:hypothetical protein